MDHLNNISNDSNSNIKFNKLLKNNENLESIKIILEGRLSNL